MRVTPFLLRRTLWSVAILATVAGMTLQVARTTREVAPLPPVLPDTSSQPTMTLLDGTVAEEIVLGNVFSRARRAPPARYVPPEFTMDSAGGGMGGGNEAAAPSPASEGSDGSDFPRLFGTVVGLEGAKALLQLTSASGARLYAAGDRDAGFTVVSVAPRGVVLRGPGGRRTLRLVPEDRP